MALLLALAALSFFVYRLWSRLSRTESILTDLTRRLYVLESRPADAAPPPQPAQPSAEPARVPPPAAAPPRAPVIPPVSVAPPASVATPPPVAAPASVATPARVPTPVSAPATPPRQAAASLESQADLLESRIGSRWLLYVGVVAIIIGVSYFEKLAIESRWIGETARVIQGAIFGIVLVGAGLRFVRAGYQLYGRVLSGCGIAVLYVSTYAAFNLYHLISRPAAFALMSLVTLLAALLADRQRAQSLAIVAVSGGFATPFLIPSSSDAHIAFFTYEAILIGATLFLGRRRDWPALNIVSYVFTVLTTAAWAADAYRPSQYLSTELFLTLFCGMFLFVLYESRHSRHPWAPLARRILWTAPFVYYLASLGILGSHSPALLTFLVLLSMVGAGAGLRGAGWAPLPFCVASVVPLLFWSQSYVDGVWLRAGLAACWAIYAINLAVLLTLTLRERGIFGNAEIVLLHLNGLAAFAGAYLLLTPLYPAATAPVAAAFALWHGALAVSLPKRCREEALHFVALAFTLLTIAVGLRWEGAWAASAWAAEGAALMFLALRERRDWLRVGGVFLFAIGVEGMFFVQVSSPARPEHVLFNARAACGLFIAGLAYLMAFAHHRLSKPATRNLETGIGLVIAKLLLLSVALSEVVWYWAQHPRTPFEPVSQCLIAVIAIAAAIMWMGLARQQEWMRAIGGLLFAIAGTQLLAAQLAPAPFGYVTLLNARAGAGIFAVAVLYLLATLHNRLGKHVPDLPVNLAVLTTAASLLTLSFLSSEINAYWAARGAGASVQIAREGVQTIAWACVGSFLIWRGLLNSRGWVRGLGAWILLMAVLRLLGVQFFDAGPGYIVAANARVAAGVVVIVLLYALAFLYRSTGSTADAGFRPFAALLLTASVITLSLFTSEITAYWRVRDLGVVAQASSPDSAFAREMMLSVTWAAYATLLIVAGLKKHFAPIRYFAMAVFVVTIVKVFAIDLAELQRIYRVLSIIGLGVALLLSSYLYQRLATAQE